MRKILQGVRQFQTQVFLEQKNRFEELAQKPQSPMAMFITCSDSRINPNLITSTDPGELFILRNAGNIIPPFGAANGGEGATIEYAVTVLKLRNIIICGHYHCGAMHSLLRLDKLGDLPSVRAWFSHAEATRWIMKDKYADLTLDEQNDRAVEQNILVQIDNLRTHPCVAAGIARGNLNVYGWTYRIETGEVAIYDPLRAQFVLLNQVNPEPSLPQLAFAMVS